MYPPPMRPILLSIAVLLSVRMCRPWTASPAVRAWGPPRGLRKSARTRRIGRAEYHFETRMGTPLLHTGRPTAAGVRLHPRRKRSSPADRSREVRHYFTDRRRAGGVLPHLDAPSRRAGARSDRLGRGWVPRSTSPPRLGAATARLARRIACGVTSNPSFLELDGRSFVGNLPQQAVNYREICYDALDPDRNRNIETFGAVPPNRPPPLMNTTGCRYLGSRGSFDGGAI